MCTGKLGFNSPAQDCSLVGGSTSLLLATSVTRSWRGYKCANKLARSSVGECTGSMALQIFKGAGHLEIFMVFSARHVFDELLTEL
jgi:hypothetical protein